MAGTDYRVGGVGEGVDETATGGRISGTAKRLAAIIGGAHGVASLESHSDGWSRITESPAGSDNRCQASRPSSASRWATWMRSEFPSLISRSTSPASRWSRARRSSLPS